MMKVLITGASRGLGLSLAKVFTQAGHQVFAGARMPAPALLALAEAQPLLHPLSLDVTDEASVRRAMAQVGERTEALDVLVNNAAVFQGAGETLEALDIEACVHSMDVNLWGAVRCAKHALPLLLTSTSPCVVNISSEAGSLTGHPGLPYAYTLSKAALNMLTRLLHEQYASTGLRVWSVHPGRMMTDMGKPHFTLHPDDTARGVLSILAGERGADAPWQFVDYEGKEMPL